MCVPSIAGCIMHSQCIFSGLILAGTLKIVRQIELGIETEQQLKSEEVFVISDIKVSSLLTQVWS